MREEGLEIALLHSFFHLNALQSKELLGGVIGWGLASISTPLGKLLLHLARVMVDIFQPTDFSVLHLLDENFNRIEFLFCHCHCVKGLLHPVGRGSVHTDLLLCFPHGFCVLVLWNIVKVAIGILHPTAENAEGVGVHRHA